jgi:hypothetical protein
VLAQLSLLYLALPALPFLFGWFRPAVAWPVAVALGMGIAAGWRSREERTSGRAMTLDAVILVAIVLVLALFSGAGGVGHQRGDWAKHNAMLHDLVAHSWPVIYPGDGSAPPGLLSYSIAYYLPAAVVGRFAGLPAAHMALLAWTAIGLGLTAAWVARLSGRNAWVAFVAWLGFSGMDVVGVAILGGSTRDVMQWWAGFAQYSSNTSLLFWTPQHALAGWLGAAMVLAAPERRRPFGTAVAVTALVVLWSPFCALGLVPLVLALAHGLRPSVREAAQAAALGAPFVAVVAAYLLGSGRSGVPAGWVWERAGGVQGLAGWPLFVLLEVGIPLGVLSWLCWRADARTEACGLTESRRWLAPTLVTLIALPIAYVGAENDLVMRTSIPALFVLAILILRIRWQSGLLVVSPLGARVLGLALLLGAVQPATDIAAQVMWSRGAERPPQPPLRLTIADLPPGIGRQYVAPLAGVYARRLAPERRTEVR